MSFFVSIAPAQDEPLFLPEPMHVEGYHLAVTHPSTIQPDVILAAYKRWGTECAEHLCGDYAFLLWDALQKRMIAARGITGRCALYTARTVSGQMLFASDPRALQIPDVSTEDDRRWIACWLLSGEDYWQNSPWQGIRPLIPGHQLIWGQQTDASVVSPCWIPPKRLHARELSFADAALQLRHLLTRVVRSRLTELPASFDCSGGLDSTSLVAVAASLQEQGELPKEALRCFHCYSERYREEDARPYVRALIERYPCLDVTWINTDEFLDFPFVPRRTTYPSLSSVFIPGLSAAFARTIQKWGTTQHWTGAYGDRLFTLSTRTLGQQPLWHWPSLCWEWRTTCSPAVLCNEYHLQVRFLQPQEILSEEEACVTRLHPMFPAPWETASSELSWRYARARARLRKVFVGGLLSQSLFVQTPQGLARVWRIWYGKAPLQVVLLRQAESDSVEAIPGVVNIAEAQLDQCQFIVDRVLTTIPPWGR